MTEKQNNLCADPKCGHEELEHGRVRVLGKKYPRGECLVDGCSCKKFVAKTAASEIKKLMVGMDKKAKNHSGAN